MIENFVIDTIICVIVYQISKRGFQNKDYNGYGWVFHRVRWGKRVKRRVGRGCDLECHFTQYCCTH